MAKDEPPSPSVEEFVSWLTPAAALDVLANLSPDVAVSTILTRAANGLVLGVATSVNWKSEGQHKSAELYPIPKEWWEKAHIDHSWAPFWKVGDMVVNLPSRSSSADIHMFDVRFEPFGIHAISGGLIARSASTILAEMSAPKPQPEKQAERPAKVSIAELRDWLKDWSTRNPNAAFGPILQNAKLHFRNRRVTQRPVKAAIADLNLTKSRGNPAISRK